MADERPSFIVRPLSRRSFMISSAGITLGVRFLAMPAGDALAEAPAKFAPNAWITIESSGYIVIVCPAAEMGQGVMTALPVLVAEDLDADWHHVRVIQAPSDAKAFGNPAFGGMMATGFNRSMQGYYPLLRLVGAQARAVLLQAVAGEWHVPVAELATEPSMVVHRPSNRHIGYGDVVEFVKLPPELPKVTAADLKPLGRCRLIGHPLLRVDVPPKVNGMAKFGLDTEVAGMLFATVLRAPLAGPGMELGSIDDSAARKVKGLELIVPLPYGVGIVGATVEATRKAKALLKVTWSRGAKAEVYDSERVSGEFAAIAEDAARSGVELHKIGDPRAALAGAARTLAATYLADHVCHATMEPMNATAKVDGDTVDIWAPTQSPSLAQAAVAAALQTTPDKVTVHTTFLGNGFGRRYEQDFIVDAALLARAARKPVKLIWSREDDVQHDKYRPLTAQHLTAGLDAAGAVTGWRHRLVADSISARVSPADYRQSQRDGAVTDGMELAYGIPDQLQEWVRENRGIDVGFARGVGFGYTKFAVESFIDELAKAKDADPLEFRLGLLQDERGRAVLRTAAKMADWGKPRDGRALGIAYCDGWNTRIAEVAEVSLDRATGEIRVHQVWAAVDPGIAVQPQIIEAQIEGAVVMGTGQALYERITVRQGVVEQSNFRDYRVIRMAEAPEVHVKVMPSDNPPGGVGEVGLPPIAAAIGNAVAALAGIRLRHLPMSADRVLAALKT
jgi:isoquinoline 1-oxidoreductase beta subunit